MLENKKFGVISLGCDKNRVDSEKLIGLLKEKNCVLTDDYRRRRSSSTTPAPFWNPRGGNLSIPFSNARVIKRAEMWKK